MAKRSNVAGVRFPAWENLFYFHLQIKNGLASIKLQKQHCFHAVRMAERSKALRSGRSLLM